MTYQTDRIWHAKATPQPNKSPCLARSFLRFPSSLMHQQNRVNQKIREIFALQMEKLQHVKLCRSMLFNTSKLLRGAATCRTPILDKERSNRFVRMIWKHLLLFYQYWNPSLLDLVGLEMLKQKWFGLQHGPKGVWYFSKKTWPSLAIPLMMLYYVFLLCIIMYCVAIHMKMRIHPCMCIVSHL